MITLGTVALLKCGVPAPDALAAVRSWWRTAWAGTTMSTPTRESAPIGSAAMSPTAMSPTAMSPAAMSPTATGASWWGPVVTAAGACAGARLGYCMGARLSTGVVAGVRRR